MKTFGFVLLATGLALAALPVGNAQGQTSFTIETHTEGSSGYFTLEGETARNPTLNVAPGETISVTVKGTDDGVHNFCVGDECSEYVTAAGETQTMTFTAPASGTVAYFCQPHKSGGMAGSVSAGGAATPTEPATAAGGNANANAEAPGFGLLAALVALAGLAIVMRRK